MNYRTIRNRRTYRRETCEIIACTAITTGVLPIGYVCALFGVAAVNPAVISSLDVALIGPAALVGVACLVITLGAMLGAAFNK